MKTIDLGTDSPTLAKLLRFASDENVLLRTPDGRHFVLLELDDFAEEVERVRQNKELMELLDRRSAETSTVPLRQVREQLLGKKGKKASRQGNTR
jgi:hypothetical protein